MRIARLSVLLLPPILLIASMAVAQEAAEEAPICPWPKFHQNPANTGLSPLAGPAQPSVKWRFEAGAPILSSPAIAADGAIYFTAGDRLIGLEPGGRPRLSYLIGPSGPSSPAIGPDGTVYVGTPLTRRLFAAPPAPAADETAPTDLLSFRWSVDMGDAVNSSPAIGPDGTIYVGCDDGFLYAVSLDGQTKWKGGVGEAIAGCPAVAPDGTVYVCPSEFGMKLCAFAPDGRMLWAAEHDLNYEFSPVVADDGGIVACSTWGNVTCLNPDGSARWSHGPAEGVPCTAPALGPDGTVYVGVDAGALLALSREGEPKWLCRLGGTATSSPAVDATGLVYLGCADGHLYAVGPDGEVRWKLRTEGPVHSSPAVGPGEMLYFGSDDGHLYAVGR